MGYPYGSPVNLTWSIQTYGLGTVDTSVPTNPDLQYGFAVTYMVRYADLVDL
jgi:hypothetical protein